MKKVFWVVSLLLSSSSAFAASTDCLSEFDEPCLEQSIGKAEAHSNKLHEHGNLPKGTVMERCLTTYDEPCLEQTLKQERQE